nr:MAG: major capsid protein [Microvirus sp.]
MKHNFSNVPRADIPRSSFNRTHGYKTTFDAGFLVPFFVDEVLPGDTFNLKATLFARLATPLKPFMDNMKASTFFFFVPNRLVWNNWERFNGQQDDPGDSTDFLVPQMVSPGGGYSVGTLQDYMGLPTGVAGFSHGAFWTRAYNLIWNDWFRDQNLQNSVVVDKDDGPDTPSDYVLLRRGKRHDYFTSCLPWPQKGPAVDIPFTGNAPLTPTSANVSFSGPANTVTGGITTTNVIWSSSTGLSASTPPGANASQVGFNMPSATVNLSGVTANLSAVAAATINSLRQAFQIQKLYERDARGGTRYTEIVRSHFGVISPDARLQRPEYLGGGSTPVNVNPIAQTSSTDDETPQGNLAAMGTLNAHGHGFTKSFVEHGVVIGLVCVDADLNYQQGLNRMWSRSTRWDFYWPALSHLGEQAVLNKEIYTQGSANPTADAAVFGYQERFAEYRYKPSQITGQLRSTYAQSLDVWHLAQEFSSLPVLNATFIQSDPPVDRVIAVPSEPHFLFDSYIDLKCVRPMPVYSVPGLIDHF